MKHSINLAHPLSSNGFQKFCAAIGANQRLRPKYPSLATQFCLFTKVENFQIKHRGPVKFAEDRPAAPPGFLVFKNTIYDNPMQ